MLSLNYYDQNENSFGIVRNAKDNPSGMPADTHRIGNLRFKVRNTTALCNMITTNLNKHIKRSDYMSRIPTVGLQKAFNKLKDGQQYARYNENHVLEHTSDWFKGIEQYRYIHYGVFVGSVTYYHEEHKTVVSVDGYGWSRTDCDNMNGLLRVLGIYSVSVYRHYDELYLTTGNKKEQLKEVVL